MAPKGDRKTDAKGFLAGGGEMGALVRAHDWSRTPLGPLESWPQSLSSAVSICLNSRFPIAVYWGPDLALLYNDTWSPIPGDKHPWALGRPGRDVWPEIWATIGPLFDRVQATGEGVWQEDQLLPMHRHGYTEECYFNFTFSPIRAEDGSIGGIFNAVVETTFRVIEERRTRVLSKLGERIALARSAEEACTLAAEALGSAPADVPFCLLYLLDGNTGHARLAAIAGLDRDGPASPLAVELDAAAPAWPFREVRESGGPVIIEDLGGRFGFALPGGPWPEPAQSALVIRVGGLQAGEPAGFLVAGTSPRRAIDDAYQTFLERAAVHVATAVANAHAYEEERRRAEALAEIDRAKTIFFSNVSHEFRTPLTLMMSPLEEVLGRPEAQVSVHGRELLGVAHRNSLRLLKLVNTLLDFSRIEAGRVQAVYEPVDLAALTAELASNFRSACEKAGLALTVECQPLGEPVYVDRDMWEKIVLNLLSNAFKYTLKGGIAVTLSRDGDHVALSVQDTGIGIPPVEIPHLFERFHRVEGAEGRTHEGTGIGLALVQELAKLHGGAVRAESAYGAGSTFTVALPLGTAHLPQDRIRAARTLASTAVGARSYVEEALRWLPGGNGGEDAESAAARPLLPEQELPVLAGRGAGDEPRGERPLVLLADDNADMRDYVRRLLARRYAVETVVDGAAALASARRRRPDLILSDVMMPRLDGFGLLWAVRADPALADVPVLLLSARAGEEASVEGLEAGADDYLVKPFSARELMARVAANLEGARLRRQAAERERRLRAEAEAARGRFASIIEHLPFGIVLAEASGRVVLGNPAMEEILGHRLRPVPSVADYGAWSVYHPNGHRLAPNEYALARALGGEIVAGDEFRYRPPEGDEFWVRTSGIPIRNRHGEVVGAVAVVVDIDQEKRTTEALREETRTLETLNRTGSALAANLDLERVVQGVTDAAVELSGAEFGAFFYNVAGEEGETYRLYTLSGAPREAFAKFPQPRNTGVFGPTFRGESIVRSDDITKDPRYGKNAPYHGMPEGHLPVRSYLAVPVLSRSGEVLGGLFFGHSKPGVFTERIERIVAGIAAQAAVAIDNAQLYQAAQREIAARRETEEKLRHLNDTLEQRVSAEIARRMKAEEALRHAQKMEAIGQLTGGVAHDFNNLLTVVLGNVEAVRRRVLSRDIPRADDEIRRLTDAAMRGAERGATLTQRLLAFARRQPLHPKPLDANKLVPGMSDLLHRTLGEAIVMETVLAGGLWRTLADPNQLENALLNLAVNARDAMPDGGKLTIETANAYLDDAYAAAHDEVAPGQYVVIAVTDDGAGMSKGTLEKAFEPFFTTKPIGQGTGLGLSQVFGFVKQSGGHVKIYSEPDQGTTVKLYLPRLAAGEIADTGGAAADPLPAGTRDETLLVVEDDEDVRAYTVAMLRELGYGVIEAPDGPMALRLLDAHPGVKLLFTDVGLPGGLNGRQLADEARRRFPALPVLFTTGYARNAIVHNGTLDAGVELIGKPFTYSALAAKVRQMLE